MALIPRPKFPKTIRLPFVPPIRVRYVTDKQLRARGMKVWGYWNDAAKPTIYINKDAPLWMQAETLYHEIDHAHTDMEFWLRQYLVEPMKVEAGQTAGDMREDDDD
jgi:Zn-dependent peptidase ImmA (M78 family)